VVRGQPSGLPSDPKIQFQDQERGARGRDARKRPRRRDSPRPGRGLELARAVNQNAAAFPRRRGELPGPKGFKGWAGHMVHSRGAAGQ